MFYHSINGEFAAASDLAAGPRDRGLAYGHGLFESIGYHSGQLPHKQRHMQRLCADALVLGIELDPATISAYLDRLPSSASSRRGRRGRGQACGNRRLRWARLSEPGRYDSADHLPAC